MEFALLERCHVLLRELEPFAACPTIIEATTPESFNTRQIIGSDGVDQFGLSGKAMVICLKRRSALSLRPIL
ncbi:MAG: hypothetical protein R3D69_05895 [Xanthobacteraceae bacterium]